MFLVEEEEEEEKEVEKEEVNRVFDSNNRASLFIYNRSADGFSEEHVLNSAHFIFPFLKFCWPLSSLTFFKVFEPCTEVHPKKCQMIRRIFLQSYFEVQGKSFIPSPRLLEAIVMQNRTPISSSMRFVGAQMTIQGAVCGPSHACSLNSMPSAWKSASYSQILQPLFNLSQI